MTSKSEYGTGREKKAFRCFTEETRTLSRERHWGIQEKLGFVYLSFVRMFLEFAFVRPENEDPRAGSPELDN